MPARPEDFLQTAKQLIESDNSTEADQRSAISRSYYAMYHKVLSILDKEPWSYSGQGCHASLITYLQNDAANEESIDHRQLKRLSYQLRQSRDNRVIADYELEKEISQNLVSLSITTAEKCMDLADQLTSSKGSTSSTG
ncbi:hypothetical protein C1S86_11310 [Vibrio parahaemolyticus]|uniref:hypothetical protein n=1 Tax=Vibrio parahaemolyticus TaxID=670 RepID=UPI000993ED3E|nr:hypothetical protein [Vibrio parahaemolyticus]OOQ70149.1 hypothetical protein BSR61_10180 [Vibrio parahaemolyticus]PMT76146.1 hypothetical protein C1S97_14255 [Vibrio parahaemolyticus]PMT81682.1 hypothetical protein C1S86_11310 [Vibrio parahaemolyticus]